MIHFLTRGLSSDVVLRLRAHSTSGNRVSVAASQQARVVHVGLLCQSLSPCNWPQPDCRFIFHSSDLGSASVLPDLLIQLYLRALTKLQL